MIKKSPFFVLSMGLVLLGVTLLSCVDKRSKNPKNTLYLALAARVKTLDPIRVSDVYSASSVSKVYEPLLQYHYLKRPLVLEGNLSESLPKMSQDGKTMTFQIKKGILFQDDPCFASSNGKGREVSAKDFIYSFKRVADPKNQSSNWWTFDGYVVGLNEWREQCLKTKKCDYTQPIEGLTAPDRYTLKIKLTKPSSQFLYYLAMVHTSVVPKEAVKYYGEDFRTNPVGTGPFSFDREASHLSSKLEFIKNPTYHKDLYPSEGEQEDREKGLLKDAGKQLPLVDKIVAEVFQESQPMWLKFRSGELDISGIPKDNFQNTVGPEKKLKGELKNEGVILKTKADADLTYTGFNLSDPLLGKNKYLRQAIALAYNMKPIIEIFYNGRAIPAMGPIPPGFSGHDPNYINPYRVFDLKKARELLVKAGYPKGKGLPPLHYISNTSTTARQLSELFAKQMDAIGIRLRIDLKTWPKFSKSLVTGNFQLFGMGWRGDYPDAQNFLQLFYGKNVPPHGINYAKYQNPRFDALYEAAKKLKESPARSRLYQKMVSILAEDVPVIFGAHRIRYALLRPWVKNYKLIDFEYNQSKYYRIESSIREKWKK